MKRRLHKGPDLCPQDDGSKTMENEWNIIYREDVENPVTNVIFSNTNVTRNAQ